MIFERLSFVRFSNFSLRGIVCNSQDLQETIPKSVELGIDSSSSRMDNVLYEVWRSAKLQSLHLASVVCPAVLSEAFV